MAGDKVIHLIRHADAGERGTGPADTRRELSARGRRESKWLVKHLAGAEIKRVVSSPYLRCLQTVAPLARANGLEVTPDDVLAEGNGADPCLRLMRDLGEAGAALCSHGDVISEVVDELAAAGLIPAAEVRYRKGSVWSIEVWAGKFVLAAYSEPPR